MAFYKCLNQSLRNNLVPLYICIRKSSSGFDHYDVIGSREIVGPGINTQYSYTDHPAFPFPAIRFNESSKEILSLREKEKGDWRNMSIEDKKALYRYSFCQTYAEMNAPSGIWKSIVGKGLFWTSIGIWLFLLMKVVLFEPLPETFDEDRQRAQLKRIIALEVNPITGIASKWNYEEDRWK